MHQAPPGASGLNRSFLRVVCERGAHGAKNGKEHQSGRVSWLGCCAQSWLLPHPPRSHFAASRKMAVGKRAKPVSPAVRPKDEPERTRPPQKNNSQKAQKPINIAYHLLWELSIEQK